MVNRDDLKVAADSSARIRFQLRQKLGGSTSDHYHAKVTINLICTPLIEIKTCVTEFKKLGIRRRSCGYDGEPTAVAIPAVILG